MLVRSWLHLRAPRQCQQHVYDPLNGTSKQWQHGSRLAFHTTSRQYDETGMSNHYETLDLPVDASPGEIKKQFYKLSKSHHPDLHPDDSSAAQEFVKISEAYATLGSAEKKSRYDRDFLRSAPSSGGGASTRGGSYSSASTTPAGGRPASGLSRRRTKFTGPPPSFYRAGGWGAQGAKREEAAQQASHTYEAQGNAQSGSSGPAGTGPGGFAQGFGNDVPHFNHRGHYETHSTIERHRAQKSRGKRDVNIESITEFSGNSHLFNFVLFTGMLGIIYGVSGLLMGGGFSRGAKQREKA